MWTPSAQTSPFGIDWGLGSMVVVAATLVAGVVFPPAERIARLAVVAVAVGGYASTAGAAASLATAGTGFLLYTGFLVNRHGELAWAGASSVRDLATCVLAAGAGIGWQWIGRVRARIAVDVAIDQMLDAHSREKE